jgi:hypothetical protein
MRRRDFPTRLIVDSLARNRVAGELSPVDERVSLRANEVLAEIRLAPDWLMRAGC